MKKNGFTLVEVLVAFVLTAAMLILLLEVAFSLKTKSLEKDVRINLINKQGIISSRINDDFINKNILKITKNEDNSVNITYTDDSVALLKVDINDNYIRYGDYATSLDGSVKINGYKVISEAVEGGENTLISIIIDISHPTIDDDLSIEAHYMHKSSEVIAVDKVEVNG